MILCRTFHTISDVVKRDIKGYGLNLTEFEALELLHHKGNQTIQEIGKKVLLTSGSMTYVIDQLVKKELVRRVVCSEDKRITYVQETQKGCELMSSIFPKHTSCIEHIFNPLTETEIISLTGMLKRISASILREKE